jgi:hypothetical protein
MNTDYDITKKIFSLQLWFWITTNQSVLQNQEQKYLQNYICKDIAHDRCYNNFNSCLNIEGYKVCLKIHILQNILYKTFWKFNMNEICF